MSPIGTKGEIMFEAVFDIEETEVAESYDRTSLVLLAKVARGFVGTVGSVAA